MAIRIDRGCMVFAAIAMLAACGGGGSGGGDSGASSGTGGSGTGGSGTGGSPADGGSGGTGGTGTGGAGGVAGTGGAPGGGGAKKVVKVSAGQKTWCALLDDHTMRCNVGSGFQQVAGLSNVVDIAVSVDAWPVCAVLADGTVKCWGDNATGDLGNGTEKASDTPVTVAGITNAKAVAAGQLFACALLADGTVKCWGSNAWWELGSGTAVNPTNTGEVSTGPELCDSGQRPCSKTPIAVPGITGAKQISVGAAHACAVLGDGTIKCWGARLSGLMGDGIIFEPDRCNPLACFVKSPVTVSGIADAAKVSTAWYHTCAVTTAGAVKCWGANDYGNLGVGNATGPDSCGGQPCAKTPVPVSGITAPVTDVSVGAKFGCVVLMDGTVRCWGKNDEGQLGNGTMDDATTAVSPSGLTSVAGITLGFDFSIATLTDGTARVWGSDNSSALGLGRAAADKCFLGILECSKTPVAPSKTLYGGTD